ncbi:toll/interleukin-1 receptor domain-containing protein [Cellulosimicrobium aquatile]|uniref:toll/interleukin-1 receptor domain-containing protein n=1 Tax=Cellulosimicrobium aquatile TaxID=1612203 RepID=UPI000970BD2E|nr:toll/interleukin-1 receptor domain-containing protein [Cellulosimicrobium aquatile]
MKIFISWSGRESRALAEGLKSWLEMLIQSADIYMSAVDNDPGIRWSSRVTEWLEDSQFGILCMTPDNLDSRWLLFEAGAISKKVGKSRVVPLLHRLRPADIEPPLSQFHMANTTREGVFEMVQSINSQLDKPIPDEALNRLFESLWPTLESSFREAVPESSDKVPERPERELLEEILEAVRSLERVRPSPSRQVPSEFEVLFAALEDALGEENPFTISDQNGELRVVFASRPSVNTVRRASMRAKKIGFPIKLYYRSSANPSIVRPVKTESQFIVSADSTTP